MLVVGDITEYGTGRCLTEPKHRSGICPVMAILNFNDVLPVGSQHAISLAWQPLGYRYPLLTGCLTSTVGGV